MFCCERSTEGTYIIILALSVEEWVLQEYTNILLVSKKWARRELWSVPAWDSKSTILMMHLMPYHFSSAQILFASQTLCSHILKLRSKPFLLFCSFCQVLVSVPSAARKMTSCSSNTISLSLPLMGHNTRKTQQNGPNITQGCVECILYRQIGLLPAVEGCQVVQI